MHHIIDRVSRVTSHHASGVCVCVSFFFGIPFLSVSGVSGPHVSGMVTVDVFKFEHPVQVRGTRSCFRDARSVDD